jgi:CHASE2 domain-containing sensor protein
VNALKDGGAKQVIFDIFFSENTDAASDLEFINSIRTAGNVYLPTVLSPETPVDFAIPKAGNSGEELLDEFGKYCEGVGHIHIFPSIDGSYRWIPPFLDLNGRLIPHVGILAAADYLGVPREEIKIIPGRMLRFGKHTDVPLDEHSDLIVNVPGRWEKTFRHYSYKDVVWSYLNKLKGMEGTVELTDFKDCICIIGLSATGTVEVDVHPSPFNKLYPGMGMHASVINSIIHKKFISRAGRMINVLILVVLLIVTHLCIEITKRRFSLLALVSIVLLYSLFAVLIFIIRGIWLDLFYPMVAVIGYYLWGTVNKLIFETHKNELIERELGIARNIQQSFLPKKAPNVENLEIQAGMITAKHVGGDLYDFVEFSNKKAGVFIGDVSGKGVPAALYMAKVVSVFKPFCKEASPSVTLSMLNSRLSEESGSNLFVTAAYMVFDMERMTARYSLGGHLPIIMLREGEPSPRLLDTKEGMPLGLMECGFTDSSTDIQRGDIFIFYTDGVTEAMDARNNMFGEERLVSLVKKSVIMSAAELTGLIQSEVSKFEGKGHQHDDITVITVKIV